MSSNGMLRDIIVMTLKTIQLKKVGRFFGHPLRTTLVFKIQERDQGPRSASNARPSADIHQHTDHLRPLTISTAGRWYDIRKTKWSFLKPLQLDDRSVTEIWSIHVLSSLNPPAQDPGIFKRTAVKSISFISTLGNTWVIALASIWDVWDSQYLGRAKRSVVKRPWDFL